jgi:hypothetical protein
VSLYVFKGGIKTGIVAVILHGFDLKYEKFLCYRQRSVQLSRYVAFFIFRLTDFEQLTVVPPSESIWLAGWTDQRFLTSWRLAHLLPEPKVSNLLPFV